MVRYLLGMHLLGLAACTITAAEPVGNRKWKIEDIVDLLPVEQPKKRGPYKKWAKE